MHIKTGLKSGIANPQDIDLPNPFPQPTPYMNKWLTCWRCKGSKDQYGNVSNARCQACWPMGEMPPVGAA